MSIQKIIGIIIICLALAGSVLAQGDSQGQPAGSAAEGQASDVKLDYGAVFDGMDINKDGKVTKEEWLASGMTQDSYDKPFTNQLDTNKDGSLTKQEFTSSTPRFEVDTNKDGKVTVQEYAEANKKAAAALSSGSQSGAREGAPSGAAPGGAPGGAAPSSQKK